MAVNVLARSWPSRRSRSLYSALQVAARSCRRLRSRCARTRARSSGWVKGRTMQSSAPSSNPCTTSSPPPLPARRMTGIVSRPGRLLIERHSSEPPPPGSKTSSRTRSGGGSERTSSSACVPLVASRTVCSTSRHSRKACSVSGASPTARMQAAFLVVCMAGVLLVVAGMDGRIDRDPVIPETVPGVPRSWRSGARRLRRQSTCTARRWQSSRRLSSGRAAQANFRWGKELAVGQDSLWPQGILSGQPRRLLLPIMLVVNNYGDGCSAARRIARTPTGPRSGRKAERVKSTMRKRIR